MAAGHLRHEIGGRGRDDDEVRVAREADVPDVELARRIEQIGEDALARNRPDGERRDEFLCRASHHHPHLRAALLETADQVEAFIGGDAAADHEQDAFVLQRHFRFLPSVFPPGA